MLSPLVVFVLATPGTGDIVDKWGFHSETNRQPLEVVYEDTGCSIYKTDIQLTCKDRQSESELWWQPNTIETVVDCRNMDPTKAETVKIRGSESCGKLTYTQHYKPDQTVDNLREPEILPGQVLNLTCVLLPFPVDFSSVQQIFNVDLKLESRKDNVHSQAQPSIGTVKVTRQALPVKVTSESCNAAVDELFDWKLILQNSKQNVHTLLWTSRTSQQNKRSKPSTWTPPNVKTRLPLEVTGSIKDLCFYDLQPSILQASCGAADSNFADKVKLEVKKVDADLTVPEFHEEVVKIVVDAAQLPKCNEIKVKVKYQFPYEDPRYIALLLPVHDPIVPDDDKPVEPVEPSGLGTAFWFILIIVVLALGVGAFLYRRHLLVQAHAREILP
eukprot:s432_g6.t1